jgi:uroporphyrinogen-III decarboxylase
LATCPTQEFGDVSGSGGGTPETVREESRRMVQEFGDKNRVIWSCGGGMPPDVTTENILAFKETIDEIA